MMMMITYAHAVLHRRMLTRDLFAVASILVTLLIVVAVNYFVCSTAPVCFRGCQVSHYAVVRHSQGFRIDVDDMVSYALQL